MESLAAPARFQNRARDSCTQTEPWFGAIGADIIQRVSSRDGRLKSHHILLQVPSNARRIKSRRAFVILEPACGLAFWSNPHYPGSQSTISIPHLATPLRLSSEIGASPTFAPSCHPTVGEARSDTADQVACGPNLPARKLLPSNPNQSSRKLSSCSRKSFPSSITLL